MTEKQSQQLICEIDGEIIKLIRKRLKGSKEPAAVVHALCHSLIYEGAQCGFKMFESQEDSQAFVRASVEAAFKSLTPRVIPAKTMPPLPESNN